MEDKLAAYEAEVKRARDTRGEFVYDDPRGDVPAPLEQQIREVSEEVIRWVELLAERRRCSEDVARALKEAEEMFAERSIRLKQLTEQYRAAGQGLNAVKQVR
jgi:chorismate mutase